MDKIPIKQFFQKTNFVLAIIFSLVCVVLVFAGMEEQQLKVFFSSDALYLQSIYKDIFLDKTGVGGWNINAAPNFFPDMLLYFILNGVFQDFKTATFLFSIIQYSLIIYLIYLLYSALSKHDAVFYATISILFLDAFLLVRLISGDFIYTSYILLSAYHLGSFVMALACLVLTIYYIKTSKGMFLIWLIILGSLATLSDRLFIVQYTFPVLFVLLLLFRSLSGMRTLKILSSVLLLTFIGLGIFKIVDNSHAIRVMDTAWKMFNFSNIGGSFAIFFQQHIGYLKAMDMRGIINVLSIISLIIITGLFFKGARALVVKSNTWQNNHLIPMVFIFFAFANTWITLLTPLINGSYIAISLFRYNIYALYMLMMLYGFYLFYSKRVLSNKKVLLGTHAGVFLLIVVLGVKLIWSTDIKDGLKNYFNYYPETTQCLDNAMKEENIQYGVAHYWEAKFNTMFSKNNLRMYAVYPNYDAYYHATNKNWFYKTGRGKFGDPEFNFVFVSSEKINEVVDKFGEVKKIIPCPDDYVICIVNPFRFNRTNRRLIKYEGPDFQ